MDDTMRHLPQPAGAPRRWTPWRRSLRAILLALMTAAAIGDAPSACAEGGSSGGSIGGSIGGGGGGGGGGSAGGSIGGNIAPSPSVSEKRRAAPASGGEPRSAPKRAAARREPARRSRHAARFEPAKREAGGEGGGSGSKNGGGFDGVWTYRTTSSCTASSSGTMHIARGRFTSRAAYGYTSGSVSPSGAFHSYGRYSGMTQITSGRLSGSTGGGSFRQSNGCSGSWSASR